MGTPLGKQGIVTPKDPARRQIHLQRAKQGKPDSLILHATVEVNFILIKIKKSVRSCQDCVSGVFGQHGNLSVAERTLIPGTISDTLTSFMVVKLVI